MTDHTVKKNPASIPHSIWHADDLRRAEKEAADSLGITLYELMQRAGEAAFNIARSAYPQSGHWLILCGHGNNGGDGYVVARLAVAAGPALTAGVAYYGPAPSPSEGGCEPMSGRSGHEGLFHLISAHGRRVPSGGERERRS